MISTLLNQAFAVQHALRNKAWRLSNPGPYRIWFLVPRYHTNMIPMVTAFQEAGDTVEVIVTTTEVVENHQHVRPTFIGAMHEKLKTKSTTDSPDIVIMRDLSADMKELSQWAKSNSARIIHYTQKPSRREKGYAAFRKDLKRVNAKHLSGLPLRTITPIDNRPDNPRRLFHSTFQFPVIPALSQVPIRKPKPQVLVVGKLAQPRKQHFWVIDALRELQIECNLIICGADLDLDADDGTRDRAYYDRLLATPKQSALNQKVNIDIKANVSPTEIGTLYLESDIFALPALNEEFGISVLEAMSYGCATIATDEVGSARHIQSKTNGYVVSAKDPTEFREALTEMLLNSEYRGRIQAEGLKTIQNQHTVPQFRDFILSKA